MAIPRNCSNLPMEILEQIVDEEDLQGASPQLLCASRELRHCALRHLFKTVDVSNTKNRIGQLQDLIVAPGAPISSNFSGIAPYVKDLVIQFSFRQDDFTLHEFFNQPALLGILGAIQREKRLASLTLRLLINPRKEYVKPHAWSDLPARFRDLFACLIRLPSVTSLTIDWLDDFPRELVVSPNLENCALTRSRSPHSAPQFVARMRGLKTDHMYAFDGVVDHFRNLRKAEVINAYPEDFMQSWKMMHAAGSNLRSLAVVDAYQENPETWPLSAMHPDSAAVKAIPSLAVVPKLRELKYSAFNVGHAVPFESILLQLFGIPTPHEHLHSFVLEMDYGVVVRTVQEAVDALRSPLLIRLDDLWTGGRFPELKVIEIRVRMPNLTPGLVNVPGIHERVKGVFTETLARTSQRTNLSVHIDLRRSRCTTLSRVYQEEEVELDD